MTNKNKYLLDTSRLKKLEKIMRECGVKGDKVLREFAPYFYDEDLAGTVRLCHDEWFSPSIENYRTFDHADLESVLPDWWEEFLIFNYVKKEYKAFVDIDFDGTKPKYNQRIDQNIITVLLELGLKVIVSRGQAKLEYMCDLAILLYENGIELRSHKTKKEKE